MGSQCVDGSQTRGAFGSLALVAQLGKLPLADEDCFPAETLQRPRMPISEMRARLHMLAQPWIEPARARDRPHKRGRGMHKAMHTEDVQTNLRILTIGHRRGERGRCGGGRVAWWREGERGDKTRGGGGSGGGKGPQKEQKNCGQNVVRLHRYNRLQVRRRQQEQRGRGRRRRQTAGEKSSKKKK